MMSMYATQALVMRSAVLATVVFAAVVGCQPNRQDETQTAERRVRQNSQADETDRPDVNIGHGKNSPIAPQVEETEDTGTKSSQADDELPKPPPMGNEPGQPPFDKSAEKDASFGKNDKREERHTIPIPETWTRVGKEEEVWVDFRNRQVIASGEICMREGALELFACPGYTKAHESIIAVNAVSWQIHSGLLAINVNPGQPVQWQPEYRPASGPIIDIHVIWREGDKVVRRRAQEMVREFDSKKMMRHDWVFGGSRIFEHVETGEKFYGADSGELVCLSNFEMAMLDLPIESSQANSSLLFEAFTENIPELGTKVYVIFEPRNKESNGDPAKK
jgi:hypothetical protein